MAARIPKSKSFDVTPAARGNDWAWNPLFHATRFSLAFLQGIFQVNEPGRYKWDEDPETTELLITDQSPITAQAVNVRPAIVTVRGVASYANAAMNSFMGLERPGTYQHVDLISSTLTFNCLAKTAVDANRLAWIVGSTIKAYRTLLQKSGPFHEIGKEVNFLGETPAGALLRDTADGGTINCAVVVPFRIAHRWNITPATYELRQIQANINERISVLSDEDATVISTRTVVLDNES